MLVVQGDPRLAAHRKGPFWDLFWQRNELRSSQNTPWRPQAPHQETFKAKNWLDFLNSVVFTTEFDCKWDSASTLY